MTNLDQTSEYLKEGDQGPKKDVIWEWAYIFCHNSGVSWQTADGPNPKWYNILQPGDLTSLLTSVPGGALHHGREHRLAEGPRGTKQATRSGKSWRRLEGLALRIL
jgi:hypothetical protein